MITREEDIDAHALAPARAGRSRRSPATSGGARKTIRAYLRGDREAGVRARPAADPFGPFATYCAARLAEDPHLWATTLFDEVTPLGFECSYPTFTRQLRARSLRPHCEPCHPAQGRRDGSTAMRLYTRTRQGTLAPGLLVQKAGLVNAVAPGALSCHAATASPLAHDHNHPAEPASTARAWARPRRGPAA